MSLHGRMSYGRTVNQPSHHSLKSLSPGNYNVHSSVYGSNRQSYLTKTTTTTTFKKPLVPSIPAKYESQSKSSLASATKKTSPTTTGSKVRLTPLHDHADQQSSHLRHHHHRNITASSRNSSSLLLRRQESTFARLGLQPSLPEASSGNEYRSPYSKSTYLDYNNSNNTSRKYSITKNHRQQDESGTTGIINIGNTCFMNSILQCLSNTKPLRDFCLNSRYRDDINPSSKMRGNLLTGFADLIRQLWTPGQDVINPKHFKTQIQKFSPRFLGHEQQDSQEFLRFLLEGLHEEINQVRKKSSKPIPEMNHLGSKEKAKKTWEWYKGKDDSFIFDMFVGQLESALKCKECNNISLTYDPFWDLSVPVTKAHTPSGTTIEDCLHSFTKEETLDDDEKPFCDRCKTRRRMSKKLSIHKFPPILVLHLKRFSEGGRFRQKLSSLVKFPSSLSLVPYASRSYEDDIPPIYDLYAVSNHIGSCYGGHYTAYCSNPVTKQWNSFNDSSVKPMNETSACTKEAYVLFYQLRTKSSRL